MPSLLLRLPDEIKDVLIQIADQEKVTLQSIFEVFATQFAVQMAGGTFHSDYLDRLLTDAKVLTERKKREGIAKGLQTQEERNDDYKRNF